MAPVPWQYYFNNRWSDFDQCICDALEQAFNDPSVTRVDLHSITLDVPKMHLYVKHHQVDIPVRRCKNDAPSLCAYYADHETAVDYDSYVSTTLIDAKAAGRSSIRFHLSGGRQSYDVFFHTRHYPMQTNVATLTARVVYIPSVPRVVDDDDDSDSDVESELKEKLNEAIEGMPDELSAPLMCPITTRVMMRPVVASDGFSYERKAILKWFSKKTKSPMTGEELSDLSLRKNTNLRTLIQSFVSDAQPETDHRHAPSPKPKKKAKMHPAASAKKKRMKAIL
jgi:hypothetical protein